MKTEITFFVKSYFGNCQSWQHCFFSSGLASCCLCIADIFLVAPKSSKKHEESCFQPWAWLLLQNVQPELEFFFSYFLGLNNGKDITDEALRSASEDRDDEALASDADISDTEDNVPDIKQATNPNDEDSIAADDN